MEKHAINPRTFEITRFNYRDISAEILEPHAGYKWAYYVFISLDRIGDKTVAKSLWLKANKKGYHEYSMHPILGRISGHGGITYYIKLFGHRDNRIIKIGFDYGHYFDEGNDYGLDEIVQEAKYTIDDIHERLDYRVFCYGAGGLHKENEGEYNGDMFYSFEYLNKQRKDTATGEGIK